ncbi:MAG TPA: type II CAAX endopeptidase family protein [Bryobacteraceae bacterium]|nr:type II CAAX endopeptidase family protein [Bryobacteraceae bacterium]
MRTWVPGIFLVVILTFLLPAVPAALRKKLRSRPALLFALPALLAAVFCLVALWLGVLGLPLTLLIIAYTLVPTVCIFLQGADAGAATWLDLIVILMLWLPIELNLGGAWIPRHAQGFLHTVAYGVALTLALALFLGFRGMKGMKYNLPSRLMDFSDPLIAFMLVAPILILLGLALSFIPPFHIVGNLSVAAAVRTFGLIFVATALPEEILFRSLIQNWLMQKFGTTTAVLVLASVVFGCAHLNNGPQPLPNWRYMMLATIAGFAYGKVFQRASSATASMTLHALVDATKHLFF